MRGVISHLALPPILRQEHHPALIKGLSILATRTRYISDTAKATSAEYRILDHHETNNRIIPNRCRELPPTNGKQRAFFLFFLVLSLQELMSLRETP